MMVTKVTRVDKPKYPVINIHCHLGQARQSIPRSGGRGPRTVTPESVASYLEEMNAAGVETLINLDGGWGQGLRQTLAMLDEAHPGRFMTFARINWSGIDDEQWSQREAANLEQGFRAGAKGLKISKRLGLMVRYSDGRLLAVDDAKLDPIWEICGKYGRPIVIHVADPAAFFVPLDRFNERWQQLSAHPDWMFHGPDYPSRAEILEQRNRVIARHPQTTFVCAHFGNNPEDLASVGRWLDEYPNMYVEISARINELGRQPYTARRFFIEYQDRILFGTDGGGDRETQRLFYRFLETDDEYFDPKPNPQQQRPWFWPIYGIFLPDEVLKKVYRTNAERLLIHRN